MTNFSEVTSIYLSDYNGLEGMKAGYFCLFLVVYLTIIFENAAIIGVVYYEKALHEPMYYFLCNLAVNGLYGSTALIPAVLRNLISQSYEISLPFCLTQIFAIHTYAITEFTILAAMSYDRYVAICYPLLYHSIMPQRVIKLIIFTWLYPLLAFLIVLIFTLRLRFCGRTMEKVYCLNYSLVKLACSDNAIASIVGLLSVVVYTAPQFLMILYSYGQILKICVFSLSKSKVKALRTCAPHLFALINYAFGCFFEIAQSRISSSQMPFQVKLFFTLYFLIFPPFLNPVIYGLSIKVIRTRLFGVFSRKSRQVTNNRAKKTVGIVSSKKVLREAQRDEVPGNT